MLETADYVTRLGLKDLLSPDLLEATQAVGFGPGELIVRAGDPASHLLFFAEGKAKAYSSMENGTRLLASFYMAFDVIGDVELFAYETYALDVEAIEPCVCLKIDAEALRKAAPRNAALLVFLLGRLGRKLRDFNLASAVNLRYPVENRLASWLLATAREGTPPTEDLGELAELLGASYRQLARAVRHFRAIGLLDPARGRIRVIDRKGLLPFARDVYR